MKKLADDPTVWGIRKRKWKNNMNDWQEVVREYCVAFNIKKYEYIIKTLQLGMFLRTYLCGKWENKESEVKSGKMKEVNISNILAVHCIKWRKGKWERKISRSLFNELGKSWAWIPLKGKEVIYKAYHLPTLTCVIICIKPCINMGVNGKRIKAEYNHVK